LIGAEEASKILDQNNAPAHQAYLQWAEKHPDQALSVFPASRTPDEYRRALNAQFSVNNVSPEEAKALLDEYDLLYTSAAKNEEGSLSRFHG
jgi:hypothetical protein